MARRVGLPGAFVGVQPSLWCDPAVDVPAVWHGRGRWRGGALHNFVDDYRQECFWRRPYEGLLVVSSADMVTGPDFTVWRNDPVEWRLYQGWRSAVVSGFWRSFGVDTVPVVAFGAGLERYSLAGGLWCVRGPARGTEAQWLDDLSVFSRAVSMARLVVFGRCPETLGALNLPFESRRLRASVGA